MNGIGKTGLGVDMNCEICGEKAAVQLSEIKGGKKSVRHLCEACARKDWLSPAPLDEESKRILEDLERWDENRRRGTPESQ